MKKYILSVLMITSVVSYAQTKPTVEFEAKSQTFDSVPEGTQLNIVYRFKNTGSTDFQLISVAPTCGCTVAEFPKYPIVPGVQDSIVATFDTNLRLGQQAKGINLESNIGEINLIFMVNVTPGDGLKTEDMEPTKHIIDEHAGQNH
jgi:hypothetical protein